MIKLITLLKEIKINNPNLIGLKHHNANYYRYEKEKNIIFFVNPDKKWLSPVNYDSTEFIKKKKIPYEIEDSSGLIVKNFTKYFEILK